MNFLQCSDHQRRNVLQPQNSLKLLLITSLWFDEIISIPAQDQDDFPSLLPYSWSPLYQSLPAGSSDTVQQFTLLSSGFGSYHHLQGKTLSSLGLTLNWQDVTENLRSRIRPVSTNCDIPSNTASLMSWRVTLCMGDKVWARWQAPA